MKITKFLMLVVFITVISLLYVHQEIEVVKLSYKIQSGSMRLNELLDQNRLLEYNVIALKSPSNLETKLAAKDIKLVLPESWQVVHVASSQMAKANLEEKPQPRTFSFLKIFALKREAHAKPTQ